MHPAATLLSLALAIAPACSADDGGNQAPCDEDPGAIEARAAALPGWPEPLAPGLPGPALIEVADRWVVDPDPTTRGEHPAVLLLQDASCALTLEAIAASPPVAPDPSEPIDPMVPVEPVEIGAPDDDATRAGLLVTGPDSGAERDAATWAGIFAALEVRGRHFAAPSRAALEAAIAETCAAIDDGGVLLLVMAGRGAAGAGGGMVLSTFGPDAATPEVISYRRVERLFAESCRHLGSIAWVIDASHFALALTEARAEPPLVVVHASDVDAPDAARASRLGPGLLGAVIAPLIAERREAICAGGSHRLEASELASIFIDLGEVLRGELLRARWEIFGVPAIARLAADGDLTPDASARLRAALGGAIPAHPVLLRGEPVADRCDDDGDCDHCALDECALAGCIGGSCRLVPADEGGCDDGSECTRGDRCRSGRCRGEPVVCDDDNPCTDDACEAGRGCVYDPIPGGACDDRDACTTGDSCGETGVCSGVATVCDDGDPCTVDSCAAGDPDVPGSGGCTFVARNLPCDDGDPCTLADQCRSQICAGTRKTCGDDNDCTLDRCDPASGECRFDPLAELVGCDDGDPCTTLDRCREGVCVGLAETCDDDVACTFDSCAGGLCRHLPAPGLCLGPAGASCVPVGLSPTEAPCLVCAATDRLEPAHEGEPCPDDGVACTSDLCTAGVCAHRDAPDRCHAPDGRCVAVGELVVPCLVCEGGGVVTSVCR